MNIIKLLFLVFLFAPYYGASAQQSVHGHYDGTQYLKIQHELAQGWNTWNTRSVLSHVYLPHMIALDLHLSNNGTTLKEALIGRRGANIEVVKPGLHAYDGSFTELELTWNGMDVIVRTATTSQDELVMHVQTNGKGRMHIRPYQIWWDRPGSIEWKGEGFVYDLPALKVPVFVTSKALVDKERGLLNIAQVEEFGISTGLEYNLQEIREIIRNKKEKLKDYNKRFDNLTPVYEAIQSVIGWNIIYDPTEQRVITPVSRIFNLRKSGYVLYCWDTYFVSLMQSIENKPLAYASAVEITSEFTKDGFVPNYTGGIGIKTRDRSQPPIGSFTVRHLYHQYGDIWLLEKLYPRLLTWNEWWPKARDIDGLLCWGSDPYFPQLREKETRVVNTHVAATAESGLDNSPMYDGVLYDTGRHKMLLADVGLNSLYIMDCKALAEIADILGKHEDARVLRQRATSYAKNMNERLWNEQAGIYMNKRTDTKEFYPRLSPTLFYPMMAEVSTDSQAKRMVEEHLVNPNEFWGEYVIPSISRNDSAYDDNTYWRGRIWGSMNFLVYLSLSNYNFPNVQSAFAEKSKDLMMRHWEEHGYIFENYNAETSEGDDVPNSDKFYHWGALMGIMELMEKGYVTIPAK